MVDANLEEELRVLEEDLQRDLDHVNNGSNAHDDQRHLDIARKHARIWHIKAIMEGNPLPTMPEPAAVPASSAPMPTIPGLLVEKTVAVVDIEEDDEE